MKEESLDTGEKKGGGIREKELEKIAVLLMG